MRKVFLLAGCVLLIAGGCLAKKPQANVIDEVAAIVPMSAAAKAPDEPIKKGAGALPCLQFADNQGFLRWVDAYEAGENAEAMTIAGSIHLPKKPSLSFLEALKVSHPDDVLQTQVCVIHNNLGLITWNSDLPQKTDIYAYYDGETSKIEINRPDEQLGTYCLPDKITDSEMIYVCGKEHLSWKQIHINRKTGEMRAVLCEQENAGEDTDLWEGCLY